MSDHGSNQPDPDQPDWTQPQYGQPPQGQPQYGQPPQGQPQYGQPQYGQQPYGSPPDNYLVWAILSTIFCCWPLGIVSIIYAAQVNTKYSAGDLTGAQESSRKAKQFAIWSAVTVAILLVLGIVAVIVLSVSSTSTSVGGA